MTGKDFDQIWVKDGIYGKIDPSLAHLGLLSDFLAPWEAYYNPQRCYVTRGLGSIQVIFYDVVIELNMTGKNFDQIWVKNGIYGKIDPSSAHLGPLSDFFAHREA